MNYLIAIGKGSNMADDEGKMLDMETSNIETEAVERTYKRSFNWKIKHFEKFPEEYTFSTQLDFCTFPKGPLVFDISYDKKADSFEVGINYNASYGYDCTTGIVRIEYVLLTTNDNGSKKKIGSCRREDRHVDYPWRCKMEDRSALYSKQTDGNVTIMITIKIVCIKEQTQYIGADKKAQ